MLTPRLRLGVAIAATALLTACSAPTQKSVPTAGKGLLMQPVYLYDTQPNCSSPCAQLQISSLSFPEQRALSQLVEQKLAHMFSELNEGLTPAATNLNEVIDIFWEHADESSNLLLSTSLFYANPDFTVLKSEVGQYFGGGAHGSSNIQLTNWDNANSQVLQLEDLIETGQLPAFYQLQEQAYEAWLPTQEQAREDEKGYKEMWPFTPSTNIGLGNYGLITQYNSYEIAPYSAGQPTTFIPYSELKGILKPRYFPAP